MYEYDEECLKIFLKKQLQLFDEPVAETMEEAEAFLEDCMAVVVDSLDEVIEYFDENGMDISDMTDEEIEDLARKIEYKWQSEGYENLEEIESSRQIKSSTEGFFSYCFDDVNGLCQEFQTLAECKRAARQHSEENPDFEVNIYGMSSFKYLNGKRI